MEVNCACWRNQMRNKIYLFQEVSDMRDRPIIRDPECVPAGCFSASNTFLILAMIATCLIDG